MATYNCYYTNCGSATSNTTTWTTWTGASDNDSTSSAENTVWYSWQGNGTAAASGTTTVTDSSWTIWVSDGSSSYGQISTPVESDKDRKKWLRIENRQRVIAEKKAKIREAKARRLLKEVITPEENKQLDEKGYFELVSVKSGQKYRVYKGRSRNIRKLDAQGKEIGTVCFHPREAVHDYDTMAIQALMLRNDEEEVKKVANFS